MTFRLLRHGALLRRRRRSGRVHSARRDRAGRADPDTGGRRPLRRRRAGAPPGTPGPTRTIDRSDVHDHGDRTVPGAGTIVDRRASPARTRRLRRDLPTGPRRSCRRVAAPDPRAPDTPASTGPRNTAVGDSRSSTPRRGSSSAHRRACRGRSTWSAMCSPGARSCCSARPNSEHRTCVRRSPASACGASCSPSREPAVTSARSRRAPSSTATTTSSTARRCGARAAATATGASSWPAPTVQNQSGPPASTTASASSCSRWTCPGSRSARCAR